jgi:hypothetical protein
MRKFDPNAPKFEQDHHPELLEGEVFFTNTDQALANFELSKWKSARKGTVAYNIEGNIVPDSVPVFIQRSELEEAGIDPDDPFGFRLSRARWEQLKKDLRSSQE